MKSCLVPMVLAALLVGGCAHPLEQVVEENHRARIDAANADQPIGRGAADGLGSYIAHSSDVATGEIKAQH